MWSYLNLMGIEVLGINVSRFKAFSLVKTEQKYLLNKDALSKFFATVVPQS